MVDQFPIPCSLSANPHEYDTMHTIQLSSNGEIEMLDGGGQATRFNASGRYEITQEGELIHLRVHSLTSSLTAAEPEVLCPEFTCRARFESGEFYLIDNMPVHRSEPLIHRYAYRLTFDQDPFVLANNPDSQSLPDFIDESERVYYLPQGSSRGTKSQLAAAKIVLP